MAFTYNLATPDDITRVRFHIGDTAEEDALFPDDNEITFAINESGTWQQAVLWCIQNILARINADPDFSFDVLKVNKDSARTHWEKLLNIKQNELGVVGVGSIISSSNVHVYRTDSELTEAPDWNA